MPDPVYSNIPGLLLVYEQTAIGRQRCPRRLRFVLRGPIKGNRGGVLMQPGRRDSTDLQDFEGDRPKHRVEMGRKQHLEDRPQAVIIEGGPRSSWLQ